MLCPICHDDHEANAACKSVPHRGSNTLEMLPWEDAVDPGPNFKPAPILPPPPPPPPAPAGAPAPAAATDDLIGVTLGSFKIVRMIGKGGMGTVYLGEQTMIGSKVAIKILHDHLASSATLVGRFYAEARAVNLIGHENIVNIFDMNVVPPHQYYLIMEFLEGRPLNAIIGAPIVPEVAVPILTQVCDALDAAHAHGVVHRDLKPENIFLIKRGRNENFVKILDFGIAKLFSGDGEHRPAGQTAAGVIVGTPEYMAPEQTTGEKIDGRADLYSLGVIAYLMVTGRLPFSGGGLTGLLLAHQTKNAIPPHQVNPSVPLELSAAIMRVLAKKMENRFQTAAEFAAALEFAVPPAAPGSRAPTVGTALPRAAPGPAKAVETELQPISGFVTPEIGLRVPEVPAAAPQPPAAPAPPPSGPAQGVVIDPSIFAAARASVTGEAPAPPAPNPAPRPLLSPEVKTSPQSATPPPPPPPVSWGDLATPAAPAQHPLVPPPAPVPGPAAPPLPAISVVLGADEPAPAPPPAAPVPAPVFVAPPATPLAKPTPPPAPIPAIEPPTAAAVAAVAAEVQAAMFASAAGAQQKQGAWVLPQPTGPSPAAHEEVQLAAPSRPVAQPITREMPAMPQPITREMPAMAAPKIEARTAPRVTVTFDAKVTALDGKEIGTLKCQDISKAGCFLCYEAAAPAIFSRVKVSFPEANLECVGEVVRHVAPVQAAVWQMSPGFGVQFLNLSTPQKEGLARLVQGLPQAKAAPAKPIPEDRVAAHVLAEWVPRLAGDYYQVLNLKDDAELSEVRARGRECTRELEALRLRQISAEQSSAVDNVLAKITFAVEMLGHALSRVEFDALRGNFRGVARCITAGLTVTEIEGVRAALLRASPSSESKAYVKYTVAHAYEGQESWKEALQHYEEALALDPLNLSYQQHYWALRRRHPAIP